ETAEIERLDPEQSRTPRDPHDRASSAEEQSYGNEDDVESTYFRTYEDFVKRFPEAPGPRESMVSARPDQASQGGRPPYPTQDPNYSIPTLPSRPPPAVPRQSYTGVSERTVDYTSSAAPRSGTIELQDLPVARCGLTNIGAVT